MNAKKTFIPKLIALLRHHANGNANSQNVEIIFVSLLPVVSKLNVVFENTDERLSFFKEFFTKLNDGIVREAGVKVRFNSGVNRNRMIDGFFDCLCFVVNYLVDKTEENNKEDVDKIEAFFQEIVLKYVSI